MNKIMVKLEVGTLSVDYVNGTAVIDELKYYIEKYGKIETRDCTEPYSDSNYVGVFSVREETDAEFEKRCNELKAYQIAHDTRERQKYEELKKKFGA